MRSRHLFVVVHRLGPSFAHRRRYLAVSLSFMAATWRPPVIQSVLLKLLLMYVCIPHEQGEKGGFLKHTPRSVDLAMFVRIWRVGGDCSNFEKMGYHHLTYRGQKYICLTIAGPF